jgi:hypothetical protein
MSVHCLFLLLTAFAAEDDDATCLLHLKSAKSVEARRADEASSAGVSPASTEHDAWLAQHKALREETHRRFPVPASGVPLSLLSTNRVGMSAEEDLLASSEQVSDAAATAAADEAELLEADGDEDKPNTDDPFADDYQGWRSTPSPVHELPNITIGEMNYLDSPTITSNTTSIQKFIYQQSNSAQACHAKLLEVRRTLDGILAKVNQLSDVVEAHDAIIAGNSRLIEDMVDKKNKAEKQYKEDLQECHKQYGRDLLALDQYRNEIKELEQIAEPDVRSDVAHNVNYTQEVIEHEQQVHAQGKRSGDREKEFEAAEKAAAAKANETKEAALVQKDAPGKDVSLLSVEQCHKLASLLAQKSSLRRLSFAGSRSVHDALHESHRITREGAKGPYDNDPETMKQCGGKRTELQEKFDEAWFALNKLLADGVQLAKTKKEECELAADNSHTDRIEQADTEIEASTVNVKGATMSMRQLQGLLENAKREVTLLEEHVSLLKTDCEVEDGATEQLKAVRTLIMSLENCPGRNDFRLTIPSESQRAKYEAAEQLHSVSDPGSTLAHTKTEE